MRTDCWAWFVPLVTALAALSSPAAAVEMRLPVPVGEHPRVMFTEAQLPAIRARAETPTGQQLLERLRGVRDRWGRDLAKMDDARLAALKKDALGSTLGAMSGDCMSVAFLYVVTGDPQAGDVATQLFRIWLSAFPPNDQIVPVESWGDPNAALAYDWLYGLLTPEERVRAQKILGSLVGDATLGMFGKVWWAGGPTATGRVISGANWLAIFANALTITNLAIEGEPGFSPVLLDKCVTRFQTWLREGIAHDGALYEGMSYATGYGTHYIPQAVMALRLRGLDLLADANLRQMPFWLSYETLPWGGEAFDHNKSGGTYGPGVLPTFLCAEYPELGRWIWSNVSGGQLPDPFIGLINGFPEASPTPPHNLPLSHWFSTRGSVFCRSGWGPRDASFFFNTDPLGAGHTHADQGSFCLASNGVYFIADSGAADYGSLGHNVVHIDGIAQGQRESSLDAFIRSVESNRYADLIDADLKLSYERLAANDGASWWWQEYNPVERADRRALFVRGATGPLVIISDDLRKDASAHSYDSILHTVVNNPVTLDGRRFTVAERYGGEFIRTLERGREATLVARNVPAGRYHGWLLVRGEPVPSQWASNELSVNGKPCPYDTAFFGRGGFREGWTWLPLQPGRSAEIEVPAGDLRVGLKSASGGQIALAVFTRNLDWKPGTTVPQPSDEVLVLGMDSLVQGANPWATDTAPRGVMEGMFLGAEPPALHLEPPKAPSTRNSLHAVKSGVDMRFLLVMAPHDEGDGRVVELAEGGGGQVAVVRSPAGTDLVGGRVDAGMTAGELVTDGHAAVVSLGRDGKVRSYALMQGTRLSRPGQALCSVMGEPAQVMSDGQTLVVRGSGGTQVRCLTLGARRLVCNGLTSQLGAGSTATLTIPTLPATWSVVTSAEGRRVEVTGDGPRPLRVKAADDAEIYVNGVSRYFVAGGGGYMYPCLEQGTFTVKYKDQPDASALKTLLTDPTQGEVVDLGEYAKSWRGTSALRTPSGRVSLRLPLVGPGKYRLTLGYVVPAGAAAPLRITLDGADLAPITPSGPNTPERFSYSDLIVRGNTASLDLMGPAGMGLHLVKLEPQPRPLPAGGWMAMGPFSGNFEAGKQSAADVKADLLKVWPPEEEIRLDAVYPGPEGRTFRWVPGDSLAGITVDGKVQPVTQWTFAAAAPEAGVNFLLPLGSRKGNICYAVTFITSPEERDAQLAIGVDWWARAFLNGQEVMSTRPKSLSAEDGAQFNTDSRTPAQIHLRKGVNTLLVKMLGGNGSTSFVAYLTDPGDLKVAPRP